MASPGKRVVTFRTGGVVNRIEATRKIGETVPEGNVIPRGHFAVEEKGVHSIGVEIQNKADGTPFDTLDIAST